MPDTSDFTISPIGYAESVIEAVEKGEWGEHGNTTPAYALAKRLIECVEAVRDIHSLTDQFSFVHYLPAGPSEDFQQIENEINKLRRRLEEPT